VLRDFAAGIVDGVRGAAYIARHRRVWKWVLAPAVVIVVLAIALLGWLAAVLGTSGIVRWTSLAFAGATLVSMFAVLVAGPFNELLSETIEEIESGVLPPKMTVGRFFYELAVGIAHAIRRYVPYLLILFGLFVIGHIVPFIGSAFAAIGGIWVTARYASYNSYDAVWARRHWSYSTKWAYLREQRWRTIGLGAFVAVLLAIPGVNVVALAIGSAGATLRMKSGDRTHS
jgi:uncharacterized protein involved in cysteine biosynthesis